MSLVFLALIAALAPAEQVWRNTADFTGLDTLSVGFAPGFPDRSSWRIWPEVGNGYQLAAPAVLKEALVFVDALNSDPLVLPRPSNQVDVTFYANDGPMVVGSNGGIYQQPLTKLHHTSARLSAEIVSGRRAYRVPLPNVSVPTHFTMTVRVASLSPQTSSEFAHPYASGVEIGGLQSPSGVVFERVDSTTRALSPWFAHERPANFPEARFALAASLSTTDEFDDAVTFDFSSGLNIMGSLQLGDPNGSQHPYRAAGQVVTLEGGRNKLRQIDFGYFNTAPPGVGEFRIGLYQVEDSAPYGQTGGEILPDRSLWVSDWMPLQTSANNFVRTTLPVPGVTVPSTFAWSMETRGLSGNGNEVAGPALTKPGSVGAVGGEFLVDSGSGWTKVASTAALGAIKFTCEMPTVTLPEHVQVNYGRPTGGRLREYRYDDGDFSRLFRLFVPNASSPWIWLECYFYTPYKNPSAIKVHVRSRYFTPGLFRQDIKIRRNNGSILTLVQSTMSPQFVSYEASATGDLSQFVNQATGEIRVACENWQTGPATVFYSGFDYDSVWVEVTP